MQKLCLNTTLSASFLSDRRTVKYSGCTVLSTVRGCYVQLVSGAQGDQRQDSVVHQRLY